MCIKIHIGLFSPADVMPFATVQKIVLWIGSLDWLSCQALPMSCFSRQRWHLVGFGSTVLISFNGVWDIEECMLSKSQSEQPVLMDWSVGGARHLKKLASRGAMSARVIDKKASGWHFSKTALDNQEAKQFFKEFTELKETEKENNAANFPTKAKHKLKVSVYPSPGNILHTGRQLPRSPGPGVLPLLPSQIFKPNVPEHMSFETLYRSLSHSIHKSNDNRVPSGKQLDHTTVPSPQVRTKCDSLKETPSIGKTRQKSTSVTKSVDCALSVHITNRTQDMDASIQTITHRDPAPGVIETMKEQDHVDYEGEMNTNEQQVTESANDCRKSINIIRRISDLPVKGIKSMAISDVLRKMPGYKCRDEDLEFLKQMENIEKAKMLKAELLFIRKDLITSNQNKELAAAKKEKIQHDIQKMRNSYAMTVQRGRSFLCRTHDPVFVSELSDEAVLKHLNPSSIQLVQQQERIQLTEAHKELTRRKQVSAADHVDNNRYILKVESCKQHVKEEEQKVQQLHEEVVGLRTQLEKVQKDITDTMERRAQLQSRQTNPTTTTKTHSLTEAERERMDRRLQRILHRKNIYLDRERILQRLKKNI
ncbi:uncharacterized protein RCH25_037575 [Pelodytes ibericus]